MTADRPVLRTGVWPMAAGGIVLIVAALAMIGVERPGDVVLPLALAAGAVLATLAWATHRSARLRRLHEEDLMAWTAHRAAAEERLRIARDLHDLASHGLGLITVRAASVRGLAGPDADAERTAALTDIEHASREATAELRRLLTLLRTPDADAPLRPAATFADLPGLVDASRGLGLRVTLEVDADDVPAAVQQTAVAVVREGLANVARHAGATSVEVTVRVEGPDVVVAVADRGPAPGWCPEPGAGVGLLGLRERVGLHGGTVTAGPEGGGFVVRARIPVEEAS